MTAGELQRWSTLASVVAVVLFLLAWLKRE
jgi:hypothetical protein